MPKLKSEYVYTGVLLLTGLFSFSIIAYSKDSTSYRQAVRLQVARLQDLNRSLRPPLREELLSTLRDGSSGELSLSPPQAAVIARHRLRFFSIRCPIGYQPIYSPEMASTCEDQNGDVLDPLFLRDLWFTANGTAVACTQFRASQEEDLVILCSTLDIETGEILGRTLEESEALGEEELDFDL